MIDIIILENDYKFLLYCHHASQGTNITLQKSE